MSKLKDALIAYKRQKLTFKKAECADVKHCSWSTSPILRGLDLFPHQIVERLEIKFGSSQFAAVARLGFQQLSAKQNQQQKYRPLYLPTIHFSKKYQYLLKYLSQFNVVLDSVIMRQFIHLRNLLTIKNLSISA